MASRAGGTPSQIWYSGYLVSVIDVNGINGQSIEFYCTGEAIPEICIFTCFHFFLDPQVLTKGMTLALDSALVSPDGRFSLVMQTDGNLVLYGPGKMFGWASNTSGKKIR